MWFHLLLPFAYSTVFILKFTQTPLQFLLLLIGLWLGFCFILVDRFLHAFFVEPEEEFSRKIQAAWKKKEYVHVFKYIWQESPFEQSHLISRSTIFMVCYLAIAIYVVTSSTGPIGIGVVLGIGLHYCLDLLMYHVNPDVFSEQFLWQMKRKFTPNEINWLIGGFLFFFVMLTLIALR